MSQINRAWMWTSTSPGDGVVAELVGGMLVPFFWTDERDHGTGVQTMRERIEVLAKQTGKTFQLVEFHRARVVETVP